MLPAAGCPGNIARQRQRERLAGKRPGVLTTDTSLSDATLPGPNRLFQRDGMLDYRVGGGCDSVRVVAPLSPANPLEVIEVEAMPIGARFHALLPADARVMGGPQWCLRMRSGDQDPLAGQAVSQRVAPLNSRRDLTAEEKAVVSAGLAARA